MKVYEPKTKTTGIIALCKNLKSLPDDTDKIKLCLFIIDNALNHPDNFKALLAGACANGFLKSLLKTYYLYEFEIGIPRFNKQKEKINGIKN